jgi:8-oxo-dGTP pyrophosphatase MutT (NUDIX family)
MGGGSVKRRVRQEHSSGGAVIQFREGEPWVAMIATRQNTRWGLPKGAVAAGETSQQAALREVLEETGLIADIVRPLDTIEYFFRAGDSLIRKRVDFYLMLFVGGTLTPQLSEVDDAQWFPLSVAVEKASFESERKLLEDALGQVDSLVQRLSASSSSST